MSVQSWPADRGRWREWWAEAVRAGASLTVPADASSMDKWLWLHVFDYFSKAGTVRVLKHIGIWRHFQRSARRERLRFVSTPRGLARRQIKDEDVLLLLLSLGILVLRGPAQPPEAAYTLRGRIGVRWLLQRGGKLDPVVLEAEARLGTFDVAHPA